MCKRQSMALLAAAAAQRNRPQASPTPPPQQSTQQNSAALLPPPPAAAASSMLPAASPVPAQVQASRTCAYHLHGLSLHAVSDALQPAISTSHSPPLRAMRLLPCMDTAHLHPYVQPACPCPRGGCVPAVVFACIQLSSAARGRSRALPGRTTARCTASRHPCRAMRKCHWWAWWGLCCQGWAPSSWHGAVRPSVRSWRLRGRWQRLPSGPWWAYACCNLPNPDSVSCWQSKSHRFDQLPVQSTCRQCTGSVEHGTAFCAQCLHQISLLISELHPRCLPGAGISQRHLAYTRVCKRSLPSTNGPDTSQSCVPWQKRWRCCPDP